MTASDSTGSGGTDTKECGVTVEVFSRSVVVANFESAESTCKTLTLCRWFVRSTPSFCSTPSTNRVISNSSIW